MMDARPLVSCIMPTANRQKFLPLALTYFLNQDYANAELVIIDDGKEPAYSLIPDHPRIRYYFSDPIGTIGIKRNNACENAKGEIIVHWDDDDWYAPDWISRQVEALLKTDADITGLNRVMFYSPSVEKRWVFEDNNLEKPWLCGATMAYRKSFWQQHRFPDLQVGEDYDFVWNSGGKTFAIDYFSGFVSILHAHNTSIKPVENIRHKKTGTTWKDPTNQNTDI